ncbi:hypothetical protein [Paenibacillus tepidiphilus]|uniref:hypothetical protein n=1 Tax=Paenibacillus tepidiphilus TaxID=2608683 RepID=UPI00123B2B9C|nr:hypothetical protein [Paenibacillus tepidiphilus]
MKKIVAIFGALSTVLFLAHLIVACIYYLGLMPYSFIHMTIGGVLSITMSIHMVFALTLMVKNRQRDKKAKQYPQLNMSLVLQSASGIFTGIFLLFHILVIELDKSQTFQGTLFSILYVAVEFGFVLIVGLHMAVSVPKHFISMGAVKKRENYPKLMRRTHIVLGLILVVYMVSQIVFWTA